MSKLHIFNPSHDEALASNSPYYYPARAARILGSDLAVLPAWWATTGDFVLIPEDKPLPTKDFTGKGIRWVHPDELKRISSKITEICPWGWDPLLVHQLKRWGTDTSLLPNEDQLEQIRKCSSRASAVQLLKAIRQDFPDTIGISRWCATEDEAWAAVEDWGTTMMKMPWSSSGRGVFAVTPHSTEALRKRVARIIKEQGGIEAEPLYDRVMDFALEFQSQGDRVSYEGLSVFATTDTGAYCGNYIADEPALLQRLPKTIAALLPDVAQRLCQHLHTLIKGQYVGPLGIDMMGVRETNGNLLLHPCVEINLRNTMGRVALSLRNVVDEGTTALYRIQPSNSPLSPQDHLLTPGAETMTAVISLETF